jgi:hypothetical protein
MKRVQQDIMEYVCGTETDGGLEEIGRDILQFNEMETILMSGIVSCF